MRAEFRTVMEGGKKQIYVKLFERMDQDSKDEVPFLQVRTGLLNADVCTEERAARIALEALEKHLNAVAQLFTEQGLLKP